MLVLVPPIVQNPKILHMPFIKKRQKLLNVVALVQVKLFKVFID